MSTYKILAYISGFSAIIPLVVGLIRMKHFSAYSIWLFILVTVSFSIDLVSYILVEKQISSLPIVHQFFLWQVPIVWMIFEKSSPVKQLIIRIVRLITLLSFVLMITYLWGNWMNERMVIPVAWVSTISIIFISILYVFDWVTYGDINLKKDSLPLFLFGIILIYECSIIPTFAAYESMLRDVYRVKLVVYIFFNLGLTYIFYKQNKINTNG